MKAMPPLTAMFCPVMKLASSLTRKAATRAISSGSHMRPSGIALIIDCIHSSGMPAIIGVSVPNLSGGYSAMMPNHHITKPVLIGEIQEDGQFEIVYETPGLVVGDEWSDYLPDSKDLISDWRKPMECGNFNVATGKCGGKGS